MAAALAAGDSLILFPEGTRNLSDQKLLPFKSGLFHLAEAQADAELVPVWISNLNRVMPKGELVPLPLICSLHFGAPLPRVPGEDKASFLSRAQAALLDLDPDRVVFLDAGRILEQGRPAEVFGAPREERTRAFLSRFTTPGP